MVHRGMVILTGWLIWMVIRIVGELVVWLIMMFLREMNDLQTRYSENDFWVPDGDRTRNLLMTG